MVTQGAIVALAWVWKRDDHETRGANGGDPTWWDPTWLGMRLDGGLIGRTVLAVADKSWFCISVAGGGGGLAATAVRMGLTGSFAA